MTGVYTSVASSLLFPLHERVKGHDSVAVRRRMEASQWWDAERLAECQRSRLRRLVQEVARHVPYYREMFRRLALDATTIDSTHRLRQLPFLTKALIRAHTAELKHERAPDLARCNTGGSSGEPLVFFLSRERVSHDVAAKWRATRWWGVDIGDPEVVVWGSPIELGVQDRLRRWRDRVLRTRLLPAFEMSPLHLDRFVSEIRAARPRMLFGYPSALAHIARHAERRGAAMDDLGIAVAFVTAERLYDDQRADIGRVFGCRVANGYGGRDAGFIAHECPAGGMHITAEDIIVELIGADGRPVPEGMAGEVVITHLATRDFPFIRYRTGDVAVLDPSLCACGRGLPLLREIQGRSTDFVVAADGTVMHGLALIYVIRDLPGVRAFKVVQESRSRTRVLLSVEAGFDRAGGEAIVAAFKRRLGASVEIDLQYVPNIEPEKSGKFRYVVSHVVASP